MPKVDQPLSSLHASGLYLSRIYYFLKGINYVRKYTPPPKPTSQKQLAIQNIFGTLTNNFTGVLNYTQQQAWNNKKISIRDFWGTQHVINGLPLYQKINNVLLSAGKSILTLPPETGPLFMPQITTYNTANNDFSQILPLTPGVVSQYAPFLEIWIAGKIYDCNLIGNTLIVKMDGIKPTRNPTKKQFLRAGFITENTTDSCVIGYRDANGNLLPGNKHIVVMIRRFTKDGIPSITNKVNVITIAKS
jgi:hypothetical protein